MKKSRFAIPGFAGVAFVWFATHAGGGFCTGRQEVEYFARYGGVGLVMPLVAMAILASTFFLGWEFARLYKTYDYRSMSNRMYSPLQVIFSNLLEAGYLLTVAMASSAGIAACGHLLEELLGISYLGGVTISALLILVIVVLGAQAVRNASTWMSVFIIAVLLLAVAACIPGVQEKRMQVIATVTNPGWAWKGFLYAMFQSFAWPAYVAVSDVLETRRDVAKAAITGFALNGLVLVAVVFALLGYYPEVVKEPLPVLSAITARGLTWLVPLYSLMLYLGNLTTAVSFVFGTTNRIEAALTARSGGARNFWRQFAVGVVILAVCWGISQFGLTAIVAKGYKFLGYIAIFIICIPMWTLGLSKIRRPQAAGN